MNKKLLIFLSIVGGTVILTASFIIIAIMVSPKNTPEDKAKTNNPKDVVIYDDDVDTSDPVGTDTNQVTSEDPAYMHDPSVISYPIFGTSLVFYTHKDLYNQAKITLKPQKLNGREFIVMTGKGCKTMTFNFYNNEDGYYNIPERRVAQNVEYVYEVGPVISEPKQCKPELTALDPKITEESLFIFRSLR